MPSNASAVDAIGPAGAPEMTAPLEDEARSALSNRVAEMAAAEAAQRHMAAMAAAQQRAAAVPSRLQQWIAQHQAEVSDPRTNARLQAAHFGAVADAVEVGSDAYIERLEHALAQHPAHARVHEPMPEPEPVNGGPPMPTYTPPPVRRPTYSAPVSRSGGAGLGAGPASPGRVTLSAEQREHARASGLSDLEYARQVQRLNERKRMGDYPNTPTR
jgi:hypothetical protein